MVKSVEGLAEGLLGLVPAATPVATIGATTFTVGQVKAGLSALGADIPLMQKIWAEKFSSFHDDAVLTEDILGELAKDGVPYAGLARLGVIAADVVITMGKPITPADPNYFAPAGNGHVDI